MQYVGRAIGSVSKTWQSINPSTLSGAIDMIVIEQESGQLSCSPTHVRLGKFSLLRPSDKKIDLYVNGKKTNLPMKLSDSGEGFFVFETEQDVPTDLLTSPVVSPVGSPASSPGASPGASPKSMSNAPGSRAPGSGSQGRSSSPHLLEPDFLDITDGDKNNSPPHDVPFTKLSDLEDAPTSSEAHMNIPGLQPSPELHKIARSGSLDSASSLILDNDKIQSLSKKLTSYNIPSKITDNGDLLLDMAGYKADSPEDFSTSEKIVKRILLDEFGKTADYSSLLNDGKIRIYPHDPGYISDENLTLKSGGSSLDMMSPSAASSPGPLFHGDSDSSSGVADADEHAISDSPATSPETLPGSETSSKHYAKTLRLTSDQLKSLNLNYGKNDMYFSLSHGKAVCQARIFLWKYDDPIVISDIDGTITKSDALGHVLTMLGKDWTHEGVSKLYNDISNNGYNIMYLTARSVGQAESTRSYLKTVDQNGVKLPDGPVILSPDRTMAALRREVILKQPQVFKMAALQDIKALFGRSDDDENPFYAGFGNRITDAISYRSVGIPSSKIFTINSNSEVNMELLELAGYRSSYMKIADIVDHFFPPVQKRARRFEEKYSDVIYWREPVADISDLENEDSDTDSNQGTPTKPANSNDNLNDDEADDYDDDDYDEDTFDPDYEPDYDDEDDIDEEYEEGDDGEDDYEDDDMPMEDDNSATHLDSAEIEREIPERLTEDHTSLDGELERLHLEKKNNQ